MNWWPWRKDAAQESEEALWGVIYTTSALNLRGRDWRWWYERSDGCREYGPETPASELWLVAQEGANGSYVRVPFNKIDHFWGQVAPKTPYGGGA